MDLGTHTDAIILPNGTTGERPSPASAGMMRYNSTLQKFEIYNGLAWASIGSDISGISANGDLSGTYPGPTVSKIRGQSVSAAATTTGQVLRFDGTNYTPRYVGLSDLKNTAGGNAFSATCSSSQTLTWSSIDDTFVCANIAGLNASVITAGTVDAARLPAGASAWESATGGINYTGGRVGIGSATPATSLDVNGTITATGFKLGNTSYLATGELNSASGVYSDPHTGTLYDAKFGGPNSGIAVRGKSRFNTQVEFGGSTYSDPHNSVAYDAKFGGSGRGIAVRGTSFF